MLDLKPCPFCGGEPYFLKPRHEKGTAFDTMMIECKHCGALPYGVSVYDGKKEEDKKAAIAKFWNRRTEGWIHIDDKLPEEGENILIFVNDLKSEPVQADVCYYDGDEAWLDSGYNFGSDVTYWMPLPKPPEVNKND